jgi:hypothetical protein
LKLQVVDSEQTTPNELPARVTALLMDILEAKAVGRGVTIFLENAGLSTFQTATVLSASRPLLIKLFEDGRIPRRKVGKHRYIGMEEVMSPWPIGAVRGEFAQQGNCPAKVVGSSSAVR